MLRFESVFLTLSWLLSFQLAFSQTPKPRVAIRAFENPSSYQQSTIGNALTEIVTTQLGRTGKFTIVERQDTEDLLKEQGVNRNNFAVAEYYLMGKVTNFSFREDSQQDQVPGPRGLETVLIYHKTADVRLDFRVVNSKTSEVVLSESGSDSETNTSRVSEMRIWQECISTRYATLSSEALNSLIGRTTAKAVERLVSKLNELAGEVRSYRSDDALTASVETLSVVEGKILAAIDSTEYVIGIGSKVGLRTGDRVIALEETPVKNSQGKVVYRDRREIARLEITNLDVSGESSKARLVGEHNGLPKEGDIVKLDADWARSLRGGQPVVRDVPNESTSRASVDTTSVDAVIKRGDRYFEDNNFAQALEQYGIALSMRPDNHGLLTKMIGTNIYLGNYLDVETLAEKLLNQGEYVTFAVAHSHSWSSHCTGALKLTKGRLQFTNGSDHSFSVTRSDLVSLDKDGTGWMTFKIRDRDRKERKFELLPLSFAKRSKVEFNQSVFQIPESRHEEHQKLLNVIARLIQRYA